jgi:hypothetical protein
MRRAAEVEDNCTKAAPTPPHYIQIYASTLSWHTLECIKRALLHVRFVRMHRITYSHRASHVRAEKRRAHWFMAAAKAEEKKREPLYICTWHMRRSIACAPREEHARFYVFFPGNARETPAFFSRPPISTCSALQITRARCVPMGCVSARNFSLSGEVKSFRLRTVCVCVPPLIKFIACQSRRR